MLPTWAEQHGHPPGTVLLDLGNRFSGGYDYTFGLRNSGSGCCCRLGFESHCNSCYLRLGIRMCVRLTTSYFLEIFETQGCLSFVNVGYNLSQSDVVTARLCKFRKRFIACSRFLKIFLQGLVRAHCAGKTFDFRLAHCSILSLMWN